MSALEERVARAYHASKPVMGAPDDTDAGHSSAMASAKLTVAREILRDPALDEEFAWSAIEDLRSLLA